MCNVCLHWQVHVDAERFERYSKLGDMLDFVTTDGSTTQLHACRQSVSTNCSFIVCNYYNMKLNVQDEAN